MELDRLVAGDHHDPHGILGAHPDGSGVVVRAFRPGAAAMRVVPRRGKPVEMEVLHAGGVFGARLPRRKLPLAYRLEVTWPDGGTLAYDDPYAFPPGLGELDLHLIGEGRHEELWRVLGAHEQTRDGIAGTSFAVWAPGARAVALAADFNFWDGRAFPLRSLGSSGVWELFVPGAGPGTAYKFEVRPAHGPGKLKADPVAAYAEQPPATASVVFTSRHEWTDSAWLEQRAATDLLDRPLSIYEVHPGSWRLNPLEGNRPLTYAELADELSAHVLDLGFTHVELLPVMEHPFTGSWGYQTTGYFAPTSRFGTPDDFRAFVDRLHGAGLGVILDWVPAHFPRDDWALARFDGTALYEHEDPRRGAHPDWGTLVFNYGRKEVRNFLVANALYWTGELHADGLRVDAVASMLYRDYSRAPGEWIPNEYGGREDLEAIGFLRELNAVAHGRVPGVIMAAEESTAWPGVSRPTDTGGLGFGFKWNMGWMHDTLDYLRHDPVHRSFHHNRLTFGLLYAYTENFVLPLSHDEVVHGKGSLLSKMPGDRWKQLANLRALYAYMWAHPGKKLLFMGGELAQEQEWSHDRSLDWHLLDDPGHAGVRDLLRDLNRVYRAEPALWERDFDPAGFRWLEANDASSNVLAFARFSGDGSRIVVCACNFADAARPGYRLGLPRAGRWRELVSSDAAAYGGSGTGNPAGLEAEEHPWHEQPWSAEVTLPPLGVVWLAPEGALVVPQVVWPGEPFPLGATWDGVGTNFSLFSEHAERVELCLFDEAGHETRHALPGHTAFNRHGYLPGIGPGTRYGFRVHGPYDPARGHRFNPAKLVIDPYAKSIEGGVDWDAARVFPFAPGDEDGNGTPDAEDDAAAIPKSVVIDPAFDWEGDSLLRTPWHETVIYEMHVKGFTKLHPGVREDLRGTYAGLASEEAIAYLELLGVTAVELLPIHHVIDEAFLHEKGLTNYWGYSSIGYLAPNAAYAATGRHGEQVREFKGMVKALHRAGIEVILDVVYNHTAEGDHRGPMLAFRGIDNASYYRLEPGDRSRYVDFTGTGNSLNPVHPSVLRMIMDSLRYWVIECHVDGFRFDLASALAREFYDVDRLSAFFDVIHQDPVLSQVKMIAEPWDLGPGGYQVGNFPVLWTEWNDQYRDTMRDFWRSQANAAAFASRFTGSSDLYQDDGRHPSASINFVTAHDGFTLADLVSYERKRNEANQEGNRDGRDDNRSWNCGVEGPTDDPEILALRARQQRNLLATLLLSQGVPMVLGGDERGRTQGGNNNGWCQDNETSWFDWELDEARERLLDFTRRVLELRRRHPVFRRTEFLDGGPAESVLPDAWWFRPDGRQMAQRDWQNADMRELGVFLNGEELGLTTAQGERVVGDSFVVLLNATPDDVVFRLPPRRFGLEWEIVLSTADPEVGAERLPGRSAVEVPARSLSVLRRVR